MHGRGMCMPRGRAWLGACVAGGRCAWQGGVCGMHAPPPHHEIRLVNARTVRILLECILVLMVDLGYIYIRAKAKAKICFDLLPLTHRCSINADRKQCNIFGSDVTFALI